MMITLSKPAQILNRLIDQHKSAREFSRVIGEDISDVCKWRKEKLKITARAAVTIIRLFKVEPHDIRPDVFPEGTKIIFKTNKEAK